MPAVPALPDAEVPAPNRANLVVAGLAMADIVVSLMQTLVIPLIPKLPQLLHASAASTVDGGGGRSRWIAH